MRLARIAHPDGVAFVAIDGPDGSEQRAREIADHPFGAPTFTGKSWPLADVRLLAPILPSKVLRLGRNFRDHAAELGNPVPTSPILFMKPSTSVIGIVPSSSATRSTTPSPILRHARRCASRRRTRPRSPD